MNSLANPVLIVVDMQNDFVREGAPFEVADARRTIPAVTRLIDAFRSRGRKVIFTRYIADPLYRPLGRHLAWIRALDPPVNACVPGFSRDYRDVSGAREGIAVIDELAPRPDDIVLDKVYFSSFHGTDLDRRLAALAADSLVICGTVTEMCVEDTARHAVHFGYPTFLASDAVSSNTPAAHQAALDGFARNYGFVAKTEEIVELLAG
ncbi:MAG: cysteine hydrolase family protein [Pseudomonadota bacterium]